MAIQVRAVFPKGGFGFDGQGRRRDGDVFPIEESKFDPSWMEKIEVEASVSEVAESADDTESTGEEQEPTTEESAEVAESAAGEPEKPKRGRPRKDQ